MELVKTGTQPFSCNGKSKEFSSGQALLCNNGERRKRNGKGEGEREGPKNNATDLLRRKNEREKQRVGEEDDRDRRFSESEGAEGGTIKYGSSFLPPSLSH